jgi:polysaccharide biosynthesis transport protein
MELKEYFRLAWRWAWLLALGVVLAMIGAFIFTQYQTPIYQAGTKVLVMRAPQVSNSDLGYLSDQQLVQTYIQMLSTRPVLGQVSEQLGYTVDKEQVQVQQVRDTPMISLSVEDSDPNQAADIANTLVAVLISQNESLQSSRYSSSEESLQAQVKQVEAQINTLQGQIDDLATQGVQLQTSQVETEISKLKTEISQLESDIQYLGSGGTNSVLTDKKAQLSQARSMLSLYQEIYTNLVVAGKPSETGTVDRITRLQKTLDLYQQIYLQLLKSMEDIRLARLQNSSNVVQIEPAQAPALPVRPNLMINLGLSAVVGLMLAAGVVFIIEYMNDTLKSPVDVNTILGLPIIGYVAELKEAPEPGEIYVSSNPRSPVAEAFRSLRANLEFADKEKPIKTILVTSSRPGEGKTTIATNLAAIFAQSGKTVILVDADLRRPNVHGMTGVQNRMGLSTLFKAQIPTEKVWRKRPGSDNLYVITSGSPLENPAELLSSEKMLLIMADLRKTADVVVIDSPPSVVADAQILSSLVDGVILVVQPGKSPIDEAQATLTQMKTAGARMLGVVFNRIPRNRSHYYGGYRYYNHQGYQEYTRDIQDSRSANIEKDDSSLVNVATPVIVAERSNGRSKPIVEPLKKK